jgi:hypothetical protein
VRGSAATPGIANEVQVVDTVAYLAAGEEGLQIIDVRNPTKPVLRGSYKTPNRATGIHVANNLAYVSNDCDTAQRCQVQIIDVRNPARPLLRGTYPIPGSTSDVEVTGNVGYILTSTGELQVVDLRNPAAPKVCTTYKLPRPFSVETLHVADDLVYVASAGEGLQIVRVQPQRCQHLVFLPVVRR